MDKRAVRGWIMYDWANSAFAATMLAAVLPIFYADVAGKNLSENTVLSLWGYTNSIAMVIVAILAPVLGAISDMSGWKMRFLRSFAYIGILATSGYVFVGEGDYILASLLFILGTVGFSGGNTFYDSLLTDLVPREKRDMVSSQGYALGYVGGGLLLAINLAMIMKPGLFGFKDTLSAMHGVFLSVAVWWLVFSLPLFRHVKIQPVPTGQHFGQLASTGFSRVWNTFKHLPRYPELLKYLIAFWFFNDGINTVISMATAYGKNIGIGRNDLIIALLITQFVGIPFTLLFGKIAEKLGSKPSLYLSLFIYVIVIILGYFMQTALHFYVLAIIVGFVQGGSQAIARSIYSKLVPIRRSTEFFGFLSISGKFSSIIGPFVFALVNQLTGSGRIGIVSLLFFFLAGMLMLTRVNLDKGRREAENG